MDRKQRYVSLFQITQKFSPLWLPSAIHSVMWLWGVCAPSTLPWLLRLEFDLPPEQLLLLIAFLPSCM